MAAIPACHSPSSSCQEGSCWSASRLERAPSDERVAVALRDDRLVGVLDELERSPPVEELEAARAGRDRGNGDNAGDDREHLRGAGRLAALVEVEELERLQVAEPVAVCVPEADHGLEGGGQAGERRGVGGGGERGAGVAEGPVLGADQADVALVDHPLGPVAIDRVVSEACLQDDVLDVLEGDDGVGGRH